MATYPNTTKVTTKVNGYGVRPKTTDPDDLFDDLGGRAVDDSIGTRATRDASGNRLDDVINQGLAARRNQQATVVQQSGFSPSYAQQLIASMNEASKAVGSMSSKAGGFQPTNTKDFDVAKATDFDSEELQKFNADELMNYDPSEYGKEFAGGAYSEFEMALRSQLEELANRSAGGRMKTGWFDADRGRVVTDNAKNFSNAIARAAVDFSGQRLSAVQGASELGFRRAEGIDANALRMQSLAAELGLRQATDADKMLLEAAIAGDDFAMKQVAQQNNMTIAQANTALELLKAETQNNQFNAGQVNEMSQFDKKLASDDDYRYSALYAGLAGDKYGQDSTNAKNAADLAADYASAGKDWARADQEFAAKQEQQKWVREQAEAERAQQQYLNNTYIQTDWRTGKQTRKFAGGTGSATWVR